MLKKVEAHQKGRWTMQTAPQPKSDPVMRWIAWGGLAAVILYAIPMSIAALYSGKAIGTGMFGLAVSAAVVGGLLSLARKEG